MSARVSPASAPYPGLRVLLRAEDQQRREALASMLRAAGHSTSESAQGADALRARFGAPLPPSFVPRHSRWIDRARASIEPAAAGRATALGREEMLADALAYALADED